MMFFCWDLFERRFIPQAGGKNLPAGERVLLRSIEMSKGERINCEAPSTGMMICLLRGEWRMKIADSQITVRKNDVVIIPSGFCHSAEAIEDSFALEMVRDEQTNEDYLWGV